MKIRPLGAELLHADGRTDGRTDRPTDMTKLVFTFRNFANAPENGCTFSFHGKDMKSYEMLVENIRRKELIWGP